MSIVEFAKDIFNVFSLDMHCYLYCIDPHFSCTVARYTCLCAVSNVHTKMRGLGNQEEVRAIAACSLAGLLWLEMNGLNVTLLQPAEERNFPWSVSERILLAKEREEDPKDPPKIEP